MADFVIRVGSRSAQGRRPNNEDRLVVDHEQRLYMVADGMGGQEKGEVASGMAAEIIPRVVHDGLAARHTADQVVQRAFAAANDAIIEASRDQPEGKRMGTTAVMALQADGKVYIAGCGDSRAYLVRGQEVKQLTVDHSVAQALVNNGVLTPEEARVSPWQHVLHRFLGCTHMSEGADIIPFTPVSGDRLLLGSDGLTNFLFDDDLRTGARQFRDPQAWCDHLVASALERGSADNVTCVVVFFEAE
jgi:serine/threonine protein phosphatase PrpC